MKICKRPECDNPQIFGSGYLFCSDECHLQFKEDNTPHGTPNGYQHYNCRCEECKLAQLLKSRETNYSGSAKERIRSMLWQMKLEFGCVDCGYNEHPAALEFDHVRGEKLFSISDGINSRGLESIIAEIKKCEIVCANCHRIRTYNRAERREERSIWLPEQEFQTLMEREVKTA